MPAKIIYEHIGGFDASLSQMKDGWALGLVSMRPVDEEFVNNMDEREWEACRAVLKKGLTYDEWGKAYTDAKSTFSLLTHVNEEISKVEKEIAELKNKSSETINKIAIETSSDIVKELIGIQVNNSSISATVEDISKKIKEKNYVI